MEDADLQGVFGVVPTPLTGAGEIDEDGLAHLITHCADSGLHAAAVLGSNGDFPFFTTEEKLRIIEVAGEAAAGRIPLIAGASAYSTHEAILCAKAGKAAGCKAVLAAVPFYWQLTLEDIKRHLSVLAREGGLPVIFYYFPEVTGMVLSPDEIAEIAELEGIHGAKITVMNRSFLKRVIKLTRTNLWAVFGGSTFMLRYSMRNKGAGIVCPFPLIAPKDTMELYEAMQKGDLDRASELQDKLLGGLPLFSGMDFPQSVSSTFWKANVARPYTGPPDRPTSSVMCVKEALRLQGHPITAVVREPVPPITPEQSALVKKTLEAQGWL